MTSRARMLAVALGSLAALGGCGSSAGITLGEPDASASPDAAIARDGGASDASVRDSARHDGPSFDSSPIDTGPFDAAGTDGADAEGVDAGPCGAPCPSGYACATANGIPVCRAPSGVPLFSHIFVIMEENTSLSTLMASMTSNAAPNFEAMRAAYATGSDYHGVTHPSLPNYIALTSGDPQGIGCDCAAQAGNGSCNSFTCNIVLGDCTCSQSVTNLADQIEAANKTWMAFGEGMGTPCNLTDDSNTNYAVRHVPFLYYDDVQTDVARCTSHIVDYSSFDVTSAPEFTFIAPNLIDDMHSPFPATQGNITSGDTWIGPVIAQLTASSAYTDGGLIVVVWDEDDDSGIIHPNDASPIFVLSPYAKSGGYVSAATMDHYTLLATIEDGLGLPRLANAGIPRATFADTLADYFSNP
jgi:hypothetical protein